MQGIKSNILIKILGTSRQYLISEASGSLHLEKGGKTSPGLSYPNKYLLPLSKPSHFEVIINNETFNIRSLLTPSMALKWALPGPNVLQSAHP